MGPEVEQTTETPVRRNSPLVRRGDRSFLRQALHAIRGRSVYGQQVDISRPLPRRPVTVSLQDIQGRGQVEVAEQPEPNNNYTAKVRVLDTDAGAGHYSFILAWNDSDTAYQDDRSYSSSGGGSSRQTAATTRVRLSGGRQSCDGPLRWTDASASCSVGNQRIVTAALRGSD